MNYKKYLLGPTLLLCGALTACSIQNPLAPTKEPQEGLEELKADGIIALNNNDPETAEAVASKDGRFTYRSNNIDGVTLVSDGVEATGEIVIPETIDGHRVTKIGTAAYTNSHVTKIVIPDSVKIIEDNAFLGCTSLTEVVVGKDVVEIGNAAFMNCYNLTSVTLNEGVYRLGHSAFAGCYDLQEITILDSVALIDKYCFTNSGLKSVKLPSTLYYLAEGSFMGCANMNKVTIPESLAIIDHLAFADCPALELELPDTCQQVCSTAFQGSASVAVNPAIVYEPRTLTYEGDFSEFENSQIIQYFYSNETESASND